MRRERSRRFLSTTFWPVFCFALQRPRSFPGIALVDDDGNWDRLEIASGKRRDKVSSNQMGSISRGSPPRPEVVAVESPGIYRVSAAVVGTYTLPLLPLNRASTQREANFSAPYHFQGKVLSLLYFTSSTMTAPRECEHDIFLLIRISVNHQRDPARVAR